MTASLFRQRQRYRPVDTRDALEVRPLLDPDLMELRQQAERGDQDAVDQLVELAGERGDLDELRRLGANGHQDAVEVLAELEEEPTDGDVE